MSKNKKTVLRIVIALCLFAVLLAVYFAVKPPFFITLPLFIGVYLFIGYDVVMRAVKSVINRSGFDENLLMVIATVGAFIVGEYPEAIAVMLFYQVGEFFQRYAVGKSRKSIASLMALRPDEVTIIREGVETVVFPDEVEVGEIMLVRAGERIALDGVIVEGETELNLSALTGESLPRFVTKGDEVLSGSLNESGFIKVKAQKPYGESTATRILELVENSALKKAKTENFIGKFASVYTPVVVISALLLAIIPSLITGLWSVWVYRALTFLVVSCPCALVISVPLSFFGAIGGAGKVGILIKGGVYLETLAKTDTVMLDKTGTLTKGVFVVKEVIPQTKREEILTLASIAESRSLHPIARSITDCVKVSSEGYAFTESAGKGVKAEKDNEVILVGNLGFMLDNGVKVEEIETVDTVVFVARNGKAEGAITIGDEIKEGSQKGIEELKLLGVKTIMLTGDNEKVATLVASKTGVDEVKSSLLPQDKLAEVEKSIEKKKITVFVGDGINDAPSLVRADVGIAMGGIGSDSAIESADVVLMRDEVGAIAKVIRLAKKTVRVVRQNVVFALFVKFATLILSAIGIANMWLAIFADVGVAVLAILNAMRMLKTPQ